MTKFVTLSIDRLNQVILALNSYCNTGEIDCADDLVAELLAERDQKQVEQVPVAWLSEVHEGGHVNLEVAWRGDFGAFPVFRRQQPGHAPLTNEQVKAGLIHSIEYTDARERCAFNIGVRFAERAHGIK